MPFILRGLGMCSLTMHNCLADSYLATSADKCQRVLPHTNQRKNYVAGGYARVDLSVHEIYPFTYVLLSKYTLYNAQVGPSQNSTVDAFQCPATVAFLLRQTVADITDITHPCASWSALAVGMSLSGSTMLSISASIRR
jgi:hypothetical protein